MPDGPSVKKVTIKDDVCSTTHEITCCRCTVTSVNILASLGLLLLALVAYVVAMATRNWSASGYQLKIGLWDFCMIFAGNHTWTCYPVSTDFSVATQAFYILTAMCFACLLVLYVLAFIFVTLQKSRPLTLGMCITAFAIVSLQLMTLVVYGAKNRELYRKIDRGYFSGSLEELFLSWSFYFAIVSTILSSIAGAVLFVEFRNLAFEAVYNEPSEQHRHPP